LTLSLLFTPCSEDQAKTVIMEKENELKEKVSSEGLNTRMFKRCTHSRPLA
jgi:hypothetical protein